MPTELKQPVKIEQLTLINGNSQQYTIDLPIITIIGGHKWNKVGLETLKSVTGLEFNIPCLNGISAQPTSSHQIVALLMNHNFKSQYYNNGSHKNTLFLKSDHHVGFKVDSICFDCCKHNNIHTGGMLETDRLSC